MNDFLVWIIGIASFFQPKIEIFAALMNNVSKSKLFINDDCDGIFFEKW